MRTKLSSFTSASFIALFALSIIFIACKKDSTESASISDEEVAEAMVESVSPQSGGIVTQTESSAQMLSATEIACGQSSDTAYHAENVEGAAINYEANLLLTRTLSCSNNVPDKYLFTMEGNTLYDAPRMSSNDSSSATFEISGLQPNSGAYVFNVSYVREGTQVSKIRLQRSFSSTIRFTATGLSVDKVSQQIISGTANITFEGKGSGGASVSRSGTLTFNGNRSALLVLQNGGSYDILW
jgi:hypothetical protein